MLVGSKQRYRRRPVTRVTHPQELSPQMSLIKRAVVPLLLTRWRTACAAMGKVTPSGRREAGRREPAPRIVVPGLGVGGDGLRRRGTRVGQQTRHQGRRISSSPRSRASTVNVDAPSVTGTESCLFVCLFVLINYNVAFDRTNVMASIVGGRGPNTPQLLLSTYSRRLSHFTGDSLDSFGDWLWYL